MSQMQEVRGVKTAVFTEDNWTKVIYRGTCVVKWNAEQIVLNSGGWQTATTKTRMTQAANQYGLEYQVYQQDFDWYVDFKGQTLDFYDGITLNR